MLKKLRFISTFLNLMLRHFCNGCWLDLSTRCRLFAHKWSSTYKTGSIVWTLEKEQASLMAIPNSMLIPLECINCINVWSCRNDHRRDGNKSSGSYSGRGYDRWSYEQATPGSNDTALNKLQHKYWVAKQVRLTHFFISLSYSKPVWGRPYPRFY